MLAQGSGPKCLPLIGLVGKACLFPRPAPVQQGQGASAPGAPVVQAPIDTLRCSPSQNRTDSLGLLGWRVSRVVSEIIERSQDSYVSCQYCFVPIIKKSLATFGYIHIE